MVRGHDDLDPLELLEVGVARRGHGVPQRADEVGRAVRHPARAQEDLLERRQGPDLDPLAARQERVVRLGAPVEAPARRVGRPRERGPEHHRVGATGDGLDDVTAAAHAAVGDDVNVAATGLIHVVAPCRRHIGDRGRHRSVDAQREPRGVGSATPETNEYAGRTGSHEVQRRRVGRGAADDDGNVELVDETLEVQRLGPARDVLGRDGRAANDEEVAACIHDDLPELLCPLRREGAGNGDAGLTDLS